MLNMIRLATIAAVLGMTTASYAAVVTGSFAGIAYDGGDATGVFGAEGSSLAGSAVTGTYIYDATLLSSMISGQVNSATGAFGALTSTVTIGGRTFVFTD